MATPSLPSSPPKSTVTLLPFGPFLVGASGDLADQLLAEGELEILEFDSRHVESAGAADDMVAEEFVQPVGPLEHRQAVDGDAPCDDPVTADGGGKPVNVTVVAGEVDDPAVVGEGVGLDRRRAVQQRVADGGAAAEQLTRRLFQPIGEAAEIAGAFDQGSGHDDLLQFGPTPLDVGQRDPAAPTKLYGIEDPRVAQRRRRATPL